LIGHARKLPDSPGIAKLGVDVFAVLIHQCVDRRALVPGVHRHIVAAVAGTGPAVFPVVSGEFQVVLFAVLIAGFGPPVDKLLEQEAVVVVADAFEVADGPGKLGQMVNQAVSPAILKQLRQMVRPVEAAGRGQVRLICEPAGHAIAEVFIVTSMNFSVTPGLSRST